ncbi:hypothetical protein BDV96DRAFT_570605 [Lophiotrema nucula]|uniref:GPI anchored protein n=1 Tax=Lophiotrema nucula TaxID=690887 RepID=A0A6A5ZEX2_9PLEO|nr:hypothetical protein BDV96DRAFT_570605 [Lophiotrema nucula]
MHVPDILALPSAILLLLCAVPVQAEQQWPHNLPRHKRYFPEEEAHLRRNVEVLEKLQREKPIGVKKMSVDEGEMFMLDSWIFPSDLRKRSTSGGAEGYANGTLQAFSPLRPHTEDEESFIGRILARAALLGRDFQCPEGTEACTSIGAPNSCCGTGDTCINIQDTGYGNVGCCPPGQSCSGTISCDEANGYSSCPDSPNKGCCLPGFTCQDVGCVFAGTSTTTVEPSSAPPPSSTSTVVIVVPTSVSSSQPPPSSSAAPSSSRTYTCPAGQFSCPASQGGGCCQSGYQCTTGAECIGSQSTTSASNTATGTLSAPVRPTSDTPSSAPASQTSDTSTDSICPTGFYVCSAYYPSGCCRVGRDCKTTGSCAPTQSTAVVVSNGVTIVAPTGASFQTTAAGQGGSCPNGWYSCAANLGGNCCLNGYSCGEQCTATVNGNTQVAGKVAPSQASFISRTAIWSYISGAIAIGLAMLIL